MLCTMILAELKPIVETITVLAAAVGGSVLIWKTVWLPIIKASFKTRAFFQRLCKGLDSIEAIQKEFRPNGGSSLKDAVTQITERLTYIENLVSVQMEDDPAAVFVCNLNAENSFINRTYCRLLGVSKNELEGQGWKSFISPTMGEKYDNLWKDAFLHNREVTTDIFMQKADGTPICCHIIVSPLNRPTDKSRRFLGKIKINDRCSGDRCLMGDTCPHKPLPKASMAD